VRVAISLLTLVPGISGGSETYARGLTRALARVGEHEYDVLVPLLATDAGGGLPTTLATGYPASRRTLGRLRAMGGAALRPGAVGRHLDAFDAVHYPLTVPVPRTRARTVLTLLDVQHLDLPQLFSRGERLFRRVAYDRAARRAERVIVISNWVRERVIERLGLMPERVHAIHLGVDLERFRPDPTVAREPFLLYPARPWPHKNHARLYEAFAIVRREHPELQLVLTGVGHDPTSLPTGVETRGDVSLDGLVDLYRRAALVVFPSLYEGFGLPPVEAMACGCPVAASKAGSLREVCGDAAELFDPSDPAAIAAGISAALARADALSAAGPPRAGRFTWEATARAHDEVYRELASS
jgi:glycosyltransferase involved in cell wall biosynthesis